MKLDLTNIGIIAGALAVAYFLNNAVKTKKAIVALSGVQYSPAWDDNITGNQSGVTYV